MKNLRIKPVFLVHAFGTSGLYPRKAVYDTMKEITIIASYYRQLSADIKTKNYKNSSNNFVSLGLQNWY